MEIEGSSKLKLIYLIEIFEKESDDEHKLTMKELIERLEKRGISAERKSVSRDIKLLCEYGYDIISYGDNREGYFLASRNFDVSELRLLMDAVLSAKFISLKQTKNLLKKLKALTSAGLGKKLENQLYVDERIKTSNNTVCENVDKLNEAINLNKKISFKYYTYTLDKQFVPCRNGHVYVQSPYNLAWFDDKYYMISGHEVYENLSHFRVDRMREIKILEEPRRSFKEVSDYTNGFDTANYLNKVFNMFTGEKETVRIKFKNPMINLVMDQFGEEVTILKTDEEHFEIRTEVMVSEGFFSWLLQLGEKAEVMQPVELRNKMKSFIEEMYKMY